MAGILRREAAERRAGRHVAHHLCSGSEARAGSDGQVVCYANLSAKHRSVADLHAAGKAH